MLLSPLHIPKQKFLSSCLLSSWENKNNRQDPLGEEGLGWNHELFITGYCGNQKLSGIQEGKKKQTNTKSPKQTKKSTNKTKQKPQQQYTPKPNKFRSINGRSIAIAKWFWYSAWLGMVLHFCSLGDYNQEKITVCMLCCLNASWLRQILLVLFETKYWAKQTTNLTLYNPALERPTLAETQPAMAMKLSVILTDRTQIVHEETYTSHQH